MKILSQMLIWTVGPLNGTASVLPSKINVSTKSPLTNGYLDSGMGGHIGAEMKFAGYDSILIKGSSSEPLYLKMCNDQVEIISAKSIWGLTVSGTEKIFKKESGEGIKMVSLKERR